MLLYDINMKFLLRC